MEGIPADAMPFHIVIEGACWLKVEGREAILGEGDIVAFPYGSIHQLGAGNDGKLVQPAQDLPPPPWRELPVLHYGDGPGRMRILCGFLQCDATRFRPLREALPNLLHVRTRSTQDADWLQATIQQIVAEVDRPRSGGLPMLERLWEVILVQLLRQEIAKARPGSVGWLAALADPALARCLSIIHDEPSREWSLQELAAAAGLSRSTLAERFDAVLDTSPMRYIREWRLYLASVALSTTSRAIAAIAHEAGYGTEAAFNRAFSRTYGMPPAAWRQSARLGRE
jgi:AraC-like DNA-binding protein